MWIRRNSEEKGACLKALRERVTKEGSRMVIICGDLEAEIAELRGRRERGIQKGTGPGGIEPGAVDPSRV